MSVQQILDRAGIARSTFYAHYRDKDSLLKGSIDNLAGHLQRSWAEALEANPSERGELAFVLPFLHHVAGSRDVYRALYHSDIGPFVERNIGRSLAALMRSDLQLEASNPLHEARVQAIVGALSALVAWWMDAEAKLTADELYRQIVRMAVATH